MILGSRNAAFKVLNQIVKKGKLSLSEVEHFIKLSLKAGLFYDITETIEKNLKHPQLPKELVKIFSKTLFELGRYDSIERFPQAFNCLPEEDKKYYERMKKDTNKKVVLISHDYDISTFIFNILKKNYIVRKMLIDEKILKLNINSLKNAIEWADIVWIDYSEKLMNYIVKGMYMYRKVILVNFKDFHKSPYYVLVTLADWIVFNSNHLKTLFFQNMKFLDIFKDRNSIVYPIPDDIYKPVKLSSLKPSYDRNILLFVIDNFIDLPIIDHAIEAISKYPFFKAHKFYLLNISENSSLDNELLKLSKKFPKSTFVSILTENDIKKIHFAVFLISDNTYPLEALKLISKGVRTLIKNSPLISEIFPKETTFNTLQELLELLIIANQTTLNPIKPNIPETAIKNSISSINGAYQFKINIFTNNIFLTKFVEKLISNRDIPLGIRLPHYLYFVYIKMKKEASYNFFPVLNRIDFSSLIEEGKQLLKDFQIKFDRSNRKRIVVVFPELRKDNSVSRFFINFGKSLKKMNFEFSFALMPKLGKVNIKTLENLCSELKSNKIECYIASSEDTKSIVLEIANYLHDVKPGIILVNSFNLNPVNFLLFDFYKKTAQLVGRFVPQEIEAIDEKLDFLIAGIVCKIFKLYGKTPCYDHLLPVEIDVIEKSRDIRKDFKLPKDSLIAISIGRSVKYENKNFWQFINKLLFKIPKLMFFVWGIDVNKKFFKEIIDARLLKAGRVRLLPPDMNARRYLKSSDFYIDSFPNGGGIVLNEAYYAGLPIISCITCKSDDVSIESVSVEDFSSMLLLELFKDSEKIFPKCDDVDGLIDFAKEVILSKKFREDLKQRRRYSKEYFTYEHFTKGFVEFLESLQNKGW